MYTDHFNDLYNYVPTEWKDYIDEDDLTTIIDKLNEELVPILPSKELIFNAFNGISPKDVKVIIIGQDPYISEDQAMGMSFSVKPNVAIPRSLNTIFKELLSNYPNAKHTNGDLSEWRDQGVLLLNSILTVQRSKSNSHAGFGWEIVTEKIIKKLCEQQKIVIIAWGSTAKKIILNMMVWKQLTSNLYKNEEFNIALLTAGHPSPINTTVPFLGCKHFSLTNKLLVKFGKDEIEW